MTIKTPQSLVKNVLELSCIPLKHRFWIGAIILFHSEKPKMPVFSF